MVLKYPEKPDFFRRPRVGKGLQAGYDVILTCNYSPWSKYRGGGQKSTDMLARAFAATGLRVCAVYSKAPWDRIKVPENLPYDVAWAFFFGVRPGISSPLRFLNGIAYLRKVNPLSGEHTVIIGNGDEASLLGRVARKRRFIYTSRNTYDAYLRGLDWTRRRTWLKVFFKEPRHIAVALAMRGADTIACTSRFSRAQLQDCLGICPSRIAVIPNGIDPAFLTLPSPRSGDRGIVFFGRFAANKGAHLALEAYARLSPEVRSAHPLHMLGNGPLLDRLKEIARSKGIEKDVQFPGWVDSADLAKAIIRCKVVFLPSLEESFGNAIVETLAAGQQLVTTKVCAIPELTGNFASLTAIDDQEGMARLLLHEINRERTPSEIDRQKAHFRERFAWDAVAQDYLELAGREG